MKRTVKFYFLFLPLLATAQEHGFFSRNDMGVDEPSFSFGTVKQRSASISLGDVNNDGKLDAVTANGRHWPETNFVFYNSGKGFNSMRPLDPLSSTSYAAELVTRDG